MLKMKPACERCRTSLTADGEAAICSFECTFCLACAAAMNHTCPNCDGELVRRPRRTRSVASAAVGRLLRRTT
ncbi:DUF1272 domain-containing protein [Deinococcus metallilatus]|uniref:DUF1272 domain-containing protein n=1 Tax=Deinococcus metallilatus TaxID=1211322 RepID=A0AAJ5F9T2_9DEIO|nr:DUF1272 domain-containing protein [Deinococcus metallilatus]MBB5294778.1 hypothetical protein [Deinococcus metallilatus]QBY09498.1 DUF1272 domain-containing protein [Deinococcus metallilatus]RXJ09503.1 DUF1272 domain-containing protein [Deinococcus metallilatus]TLK29025.1 DUF1272 domain-containing protein [Deinococcus metallilatus]